MPVPVVWMIFSGFSYTYQQRSPSWKTPASATILIMMAPQNAEQGINRAAFLLDFIV
jgi:hypothetical protein